MESILTSFLVDFFKYKNIIDLMSNTYVEFEKKNTNVGLGILLIFQVIAHLQWHTVFENK